jgi:hypothetical protein
MDFTMEDTLPLQRNYEKEARDVVIRRAFCLNDMMKAFADESVLSERINFRWKADNGCLEVVWKSLWGTECLEIVFPNFGKSFIRNVRWARILRFRFSGTILQVTDGKQSVEFI